MPKQKFDEYDMIIRNYEIRCPSCRDWIYITYEDDQCGICGAWICPDCLSLLTKENTNSYSYAGPDGAGLTITCKKCGYDVVDTDYY